MMTVRCEPKEEEQQQHEEETLEYEHRNDEFQHRVTDVSTNSTSMSSSTSSSLSSLSTSTTRTRQEHHHGCGLDDSEIVDRIRAMLRQENTPWYRTSSRTYMIGREVGESHRREIMCDWCFRVVDYFDMGRDVVASTMSLVDRFLSQPTSTLARAARKHSHKYQLIVMASLHLAVKLTETNALCANVLAQLSGGMHQPIDITNMETIILHQLGWRVHGPTPWTFAQYFLALIPSSESASLMLDDSLEEFARCQTELAVARCSLATVSPSIIALAAVSNAMDCAWHSARHHHPPNYQQEHQQQEQQPRCTYVQTIFDATGGLDISSCSVMAVRWELQRSFASVYGDSSSSVRKSVLSRTSLEEDNDPSWKGKRWNRERTGSGSSPVSVTQESSE